MSFLKSIEHFNKKLIYLLFKLLFGNKPANIPLDRAKIRKILILRYDKLGDMAVTVPVFHSLKEAIPDAEIHVIASTKNAGLIKNDSSVSKIYIYDGKFRSLISIIAIARKENYSIILSFIFNNTTKAGIIANLAGKKGTPKAIILNEKRQKLYSSLFNIQVPVERNKYYTTELLLIFVSAIFALKYSIENHSRKILYSSEDAQPVLDFIRKLPTEKYILLNISAGSVARKPGADKLIRMLAQILRKHTKICFALNYSPADKSDASKISEAFPGKVFCCPPTENILEIASRVALSQMVISPDTAIIQFAGAFSKPVLGFYLTGGTFINEWTPDNVPFRAVISKDNRMLSDEDVNIAVNFFEELYENRV